MEPPKFQSKEEQSRTMAHYNEIFYTLSLTMTAKEQNAAIWAAFANEDTLPKEKDLLDTIGKIPSLIEPHKEALLHAAAALIDAYSQDSCPPVNCGPDWTPEHIEAAIHRGAHISADSKEVLRKWLFRLLNI